MAFRKRNVVLSHLPNSESGSSSGTANLNASTAPPGTRHSPVDGRLTTSTGTPSLDCVLAGHGGLALGNLILIEETGTTDFAGILLRHYAAEGVVQRHKVIVVGVPEQWGRDLPGVVGAAGAENADSSRRQTDKMKIAWRYEGLGDFDSRQRTASGRGASARSPTVDSKDAPEPDVFCHVFDLAKRLVFPAGVTIEHIELSPSISQASPFTHIVEKLLMQLASSQGKGIYRLIIPTILSPAMYPPHACEPHHLLQFIHALRGLLRQYSQQFTAMITLPLELYSRSTGLVRWMELLSDGVIELTPFPHLLEPGSLSRLSTSGAATTQEDQPQGMVKIHKVPVFHERGGGSGVAGLGDDLAFVVSRRKFVIKPFNLPPAEGDIEAQQALVNGAPAQLSKEQIDF